MSSYLRLRTVVWQAVGVPLGASKSLIDRRPVFRLYRRLFGAEDMHSHYRWDAVRPFIDFAAADTLEVGGGDGRMAFEVADHGGRGLLLITEFDANSVAEAEATARLGHYDNVQVSQQDLRQLGNERQFDQVLAIDVLEHIDDDSLALSEISMALKTGGRLVISVPTPNYPQTFGRAFHDHLGHVREGYWLEDLRAKLSSAGLSVVEHRYYTLKWLSRACRLFYNAHVPYAIGVVWAPLVRPLLRRTERGSASADRACSLAILAIKD
jgi:SAM-dependent methyltransferase